MPRPDTDIFYRVEGLVEVPEGVSFDDFCDRLMDFFQQNGVCFTGYMEDLGEEEKRAGES